MYIAINISHPDSKGVFRHLKKIHSEIFETLPIFYEPLYGVCLAGWHKARDPGLPKDFLLGFVLALCCCSQKLKSFLKEQSIS